MIVPFGLDPFGWHAERESYRTVCRYALEHCTLLPKVMPVRTPLFLGGSDVRFEISEEAEPNGTIVRRTVLSTGRGSRVFEEVRTPGDSSWKTRRRWIETEDDLEFFLALDDPAPAEPDLDAVREKERAVGARGLPYV